MHAQKTIRRVSDQLAIVRNAIRENIGDRHLQGNREHVEAGEDILAWRTAGARYAAQIAAIQVNQIEDALFVQLVGIVELSSDDPRAAGQRVNVGVDKGLRRSA